MKELGGEIDKIKEEKEREKEKEREIKTPLIS
jgi:hypothetical protein